MLDYSMALPIIYPQNVTAFVSHDGLDPTSPASDDAAALNTGIEAFLSAVDQSYCESNGAAGNASVDCGKYAPTNVLSISYEQYEYGVNYKYAVRVCNELMKLGLQGTTVLVASGDYNVGEYSTCAGSRYNVFEPDW